mmetsp:Transcript_64911/g.186767  ORF Transcript_64911/g.186767 Transcript_64911/m.186767 type:complete len:212 (+) Transcript_64911:1161-1796(+)
MPNTSNFSLWASCSSNSSIGSRCSAGSSTFTSLLDAISSEFSSFFVPSFFSPPFSVFAASLLWLLSAAFSSPAAVSAFASAGFSFLACCSRRAACCFWSFSNCRASFRAWRFTGSLNSMCFTCHRWRSLCQFFHFSLNQSDGAMYSTFVASLRSFFHCLIAYSQPSRSCHGYSMLSKPSSFPGYDQPLPAPAIIAAVEMSGTSPSFFRKHW